jgi:hypothetical protein
MPATVARANAPQPGGPAKPARDGEVNPSRSVFCHVRHCEERTDEAIQLRARLFWIASLRAQ